MRVPIATDIGRQSMDQVPRGCEVVDSVTIKRVVPIAGILSPGRKRASTQSFAVDAEVYRRCSSGEIRSVSINALRSCLLPPGVSRSGRSPRHQPDAPLTVAAAV